MHQSTAELVQNEGHLPQCPLPVVASGSYLEDWHMQGFSLTF